MGAVLLFKKEKKMTAANKEFRNENDIKVRLKATSALTALKHSQVQFHCSDLETKTTEEGKENTVYSRPMSVCTNIPSGKKIFITCQIGRAHV